jgi:serine/threonine-protein kinase
MRENHRMRAAARRLLSAARMSFAPGTRLGRFEVEHKLGSGGMGTVLAVRRVDTSEPFAMKVLHDSLAENAQFRERFLREGATAQALTSEHVVRVHEVGVLHSGQPFILMERLSGLDLETLLAQSGPLPMAFVIDVALQACAALSEAHARGIVHRDLKPANLFLAHADDSPSALKLVDFGISRAAWHAAGLTLTRTALGSPPYMSPEQILSAKDVDARADIWSLGVTLYELATGVLPFTERSIPALVAAIVGREPVPISQLRPDAPAELTAIVARCLAKRPEDRYPDATSLARDLRALRDDDDDDGDDPNGDAPTRVLNRPSSVPPSVRPDRLLWVAAFTVLMAIASIVLLAVELGYFGSSGAGQKASACVVNSFGS